jgi:hypothetical protein
LRIGQIGLVPGEVRIGLVERRLERPGVELDQKIARLDLLAFAEINAGDVAFDTALDCNRIERRNGSEAAQNDGHIRSRRRRSHDRDGAALAGGRPHGLRFLTLVMADNRYCRDDRDDGQGAAHDDFHRSEHCGRPHAWEP